MTGGTNKNDGTKKDGQRGRERTRWTVKQGRGKREKRLVDGLDIVSAESSSIKSNYDVIDRGPVGQG